MDPAADAEEVIEYDFLLSVVKVESLAEIGHDHNRKLQSLALVNGHEPNCVARFQRRWFALGRRVLFGVDELQESVNPLTMQVVELAGDCEKLLHVGGALMGPGLGAEPVHITGFFEDLLE